QQKRSSSRQQLSDLPMKEGENMAVAEMRRLQKKFQKGMNKRKSYGANVRWQMQAQEKEIELLMQEHTELLRLGQNRSLRDVLLEKRNCVEMNRLLQLKDHYDSVIRERKAQLAELDKQILELEKMIARQQERIAKLKQEKDSKCLQKQIETLEGQLNNATVRFDTSLARNKQLQEEIESLRIHKAIYDNFYGKIHKKLEEQKERMCSAIEQCIQTSEQQMEAQARMSDIQKWNKEDTFRYNVEMQKQEREADEEAKLKSFMISKWTDRSMLEEQAKNVKALKASQRSKQCQWESFESWRVALKCLLELAEDTDLGRLLDDYARREEKKLSCFSYAINLNNDVEKREQSIKDLQSEISALTTDQKCRERSRFQVLKELEDKLMETTKEADWYEEKFKENSKLLGQLKSGMEALLKIINCDDVKLMQEIGENKQITDLNLKQIFGLVEEKTNELLLMDAVLRNTLAEGSDPSQLFSSPLMGSSRTLRELDPAKQCPRSASAESIADIMDTLEVSLYHEQLRQLVLQSHEQKQGSDASSMSKRK
ncbi:CCD63 protein, partial [Bucco capensis]|nr:CCD63 protein [Bucco capensis]